MTAIYELLRCNINGVDYHGLATCSKSSKYAILYLHGTGGNFYSNSYIRYMGEIFNHLNISFYTVNIPGHDETAETEIFSDSITAIDEWISVVSKRSSKLILMGHSLGALKILYYMNSTLPLNNKLVLGTILLSPFDIVAFYCGGNPSDVNRIRSLINRQVDTVGKYARVPEDIFNLWPVSNLTFLDLVNPGGIADSFPSRANLSNSAIASLVIPVFVAIGEKDFAAYPNPEAVHFQLLNIDRNISSYLIKDAPHNFFGREGDLANILINWLKDKFGDIDER